LPIAPVVGRLTLRAIAVWYKDTPVGNPPTMCGFPRPWREDRWLQACHGGRGTSV
jgi:hypothetical protein